MKLSIGIVGLPNVGKSTLFKSLTKTPVNIANYPFCTIDPNVGVTPVPDERLDELVGMSKSKKKIPAVVEFYDIAGLVRGASQGEGLGNAFLSHIKEVSAILHVLRVFPSSDIIHVESSVDPLRDREIILQELALHDLQIVERRLPKLEAEAKAGGKEAKQSLPVLQKVRDLLSRGESIAEYADTNIVRELQLLRSRKQVYLLNGNASDAPQKLLDIIAQEGSGYVVADLGNTSEIPELIRAAYKTLGLITFFTTGEDETRGWTIKEGSKAPEASGAIHSDFEQKFTRAEVVHYEDFVRSGGWSQAKQKGLLRVEGKDYVVKDGDILVVRHG